jgi:hypothetical protein
MHKGTAFECALVVALISPRDAQKKHRLATIRASAFSNRGWNGWIETLCLWHDQTHTDPLPLASRLLILPDVDWFYVAKLYTLIDVGRVMSPSRHSIVEDQNTIMIAAMPNGAKSARVRLG